MKVEQFYSKNQFRLYGEGKNILQSYNSVVVVIEYPKNGYKITLGKDWNYSTTTSKYVYMFLEEFLPSDIVNFDNKTNKRKYVEKLIEDNVIGYDNELR